MILDIMGAAYLDRNVDALATRRPACHHRDAGRGHGRTQPRQADRQTRTCHRHRRCGGRPVDGPASKSAIVAEVVEIVWPMIADGRVRPIIGARLPIEQAG